MASPSAMGRTAHRLSFQDQGAYPWKPCRLAPGLIAYSRQSELPFLINLGNCGSPSPCVTRLDFRFLILAKACSLLHFHDHAQSKSPTSLLMAKKARGLPDTIGWLRSLLYHKKPDGYAHLPGPRIAQNTRKTLFLLFQARGPPRPSRRLVTCLERNTRVFRNRRISPSHLSACRCHA